MKRNVYHLDPFMFRIIDMDTPELLSGFYKKHDKGGGVVSFDQNPLTPWNPEWYDYSHFGRIFINHVHHVYFFKENFDLYYTNTPNKVH